MRLYVFDEHRLGAGDDGTTLVEITELVDAAPPDRMTALIVGWDRLEGLVRERLRSGSRRPLTDVVLRAPQPRPRKIIAAAVNYSLHRDEMGGQSGVYRDAVIEDARTYVGFVKSSTSVVGPDGAIELPALEGRRFDHEAEVGVVIGRGGRDIAAADALDHVFGYVPLLDITLRGAGGPVLPQELRHLHADRSGHRHRRRGAPTPMRWTSRWRSTERSVNARTRATSSAASPSSSRSSPWP